VYPEANFLGSRSNGGTIKGDPNPPSPSNMGSRKKRRADHPSLLEPPRAPRVLARAADAARLEELAPKPLEKRSFELHAAGGAAGGVEDEEPARLRAAFELHTAFELHAARLAARGDVDTEAFKELQYQHHRVAADADLARATLRVERQMHEAELERRAAAWSVRTVDKLEEQQQELELAFKMKEAALHSQLLDAERQLARLRGSSSIITLDAEELRALEGELEGALQRVARMLLQRSAEARVVQMMPSAKCQIRLACMIVCVCWAWACADFCLLCSAHMPRGRHVP
jgi:hypothetical protein